MNKNVGNNDTDVQINENRDSEIIAGLDLGTSKISVAVAERDSAGAHIFGIGQAASTGMRKGLITNIDQTVQSIRSAILDAQTVSGNDISSVTVSFSGDKITSILSTGMVSLGGTPREVRQDDIARAIDAAQATVVVPPNRTIIHTIPIGYSLDGESGIDDPIGMTATRLDIEIQSIIVPTSVVQNVLNCVNRAGLTVESMVVKPLVSALGSLTPDESIRGSVAVDIGGGTIGVAVFKDGRPKHLGLIPIGGDEIANDLGGSGLKIPLSAAELLKRTVALYPDANETLQKPLESVDEQSALRFLGDTAGDGIVRFSYSGQRCSVSKRELINAVYDRIDHFLDNIKTEVIKAKITDLPGGVILTGGVSKASEIADYVSEELQISTRVGKPTECDKLPPARSSQEYAAVAGIIKYVIDRERDPYRYLDNPSVASVVPNNPNPPLNPQIIKPEKPQVLSKRKSSMGFLDHLSKIFSELF